MRRNVISLINFSFYLFVYSAKTLIINAVHFFDYKVTADEV